MTLTTTRSTCRACDAPLDTVLNLGELAISAFPRPGDPIDRAPLHLVQCQRCGLVQLADTVDPDRLFRDQYWYRSGVNETMVEELRSIVEQATTRVALTHEDLVIDVGANDGTLLHQYGFYQRGLLRVAVEPSTTFDADLLPHADAIYPGFFPVPDLIRLYRGRAKILTSIACFYDVDDPRAFVQGVADLLAPDGLWVVQFQDLAQMIAATAFDNLCHEHLCYYSLRSIERLIQPFGLVVVAAERRAINGGSLRLLIQHRDQAWVSPSVGDLRKAEDGCEAWETLAKFSWRVGQVARQIQSVVQAARDRGQTIDAYGASTKGNTLLQVCQLGPDQIRQAWERSPAKYGRTTVTSIPIVPEGEGRADPPDLLLSLVWQFREAILLREAAYTAVGGRWLFPLPQVEIVEGTRR